MRRLLGSLVVAAVLAFGFGAVPAQAATVTTPSPASTSTHQSEQIYLAAKSTSKVENVVQFDYRVAVESGVEVQIATDFATGITAGGGVTLNAPTAVAAPSVLQKIAAAASNCQGRNGHSGYWWGTQIQMDSCATNVLINAIWAGAGAAALAGSITAETGVGGVAGAVVAAVLTIGAGGLGICASWGTGIYINQVWAAPPGCRAQ